MKQIGEMRWGHASLGAALFIACQVPLTYTSAYAQTTPATSAVVTSYHIAADKLDRVLVAVASQSRIPISFDASLASGYTSAGVKGNFTAEQAVDKALQGTGLERATTSEGALTVRRKPPQPPTPPASGKENASDAVLPEITVRSAAEKQDVSSFTSENSSSATLTDTPISETPSSVQTVTQGTMRSQQASSVEDILKNVSGVSIIPGAAGEEATVAIRGFTAPVSTDGLTTANGNSVSTQGGLDIPVIGIERVDVVKGADTILNGGTNPGGVVNVIRKRPQADPVYEAQAQTGSYGEMLLGADVGGAIPNTSNLNYRFIVNGDRTGESYGGAIGERNLYIAPSIGYKTANTDLVVGFEQNTQHGPLPYTTVIQNGAPLHLTYPLGDAQDHFRSNSSTLYFDLAQNLSSNWSMHSKGSYRASVFSFYYTNAALLDTLGDALFIPIGATIRQRAWTFQQTIQGKFNTGPVEHTLVGGFSYQKTLIGDLAGADISGVQIGNIHTTPTPEDTRLNILPAIEQNSYSDQFYLQDQIRYQRLHFLGSIAHGQAWLPTSTGATTESAWSPNIGLLYQLTGDVAAYANYQKSFTPQANALLPNGEAPPPSLGKSVEIGLKGEFLDDRVTSSLALYRASMTNVLLMDGNTPGFNLLEPGGTVSRGIEFDISGQIANGLKVTANYTYNTENSPIAPNEPTSASLPRHRFFAWVEYAFQSAPLQGFGVGGGINVQTSYEGAQFSTTDANFRIPGQASTDVSVFYRTRKWTTTFGVKNIFNHDLYALNAETSSVPILPGRTFMLTSIYQF